MGNVPAGQLGSGLSSHRSYRMWPKWMLFAVFLLTVPIPYYPESPGSFSVRFPLDMHGWW